MPSVDAFLEELFPSLAARPASSLIPRGAADEAANMWDRGVADDNMRAALDPAYRQQRDRQLDGAIDEIDPSERVGPGFDPGAVRAPFQGVGEDLLPANAMPISGQMPPGMVARLLGGARAGGGGVPLPRERPVEAGPGAADLLNGGGGAPMPLSGGVVGGGPGAGGGGAASEPFSLLSRLLGSRQGGTMTAPGVPGAGDERSQYMLAQMMGLDGRSGKRLMSNLAGGFAGGNPAFKGGAFMKGVSGSLAAGLKSDEKDDETTTATEEREQKQKNFGRVQDDKELTSEALRKLYGARAATAGQGGRAGGNPNYKYEPGRGIDPDTGEEVDGAWQTERLSGRREFVPGMVLTSRGETTERAGQRDRDLDIKEQRAASLEAMRTERADAVRRGDERKVKELDEKIRRNTAAIGLDEARTKHAGAGKGAWNKPASQRYGDAMRLVQNERKSIYGTINPLASKADRATAMREADEKLEAFRKKTLKAHGLDDDGNELAPAAPAPGPAPTPGPGAAAGAPSRTARVPSSRTVVGDEEGEKSGLYPSGTYDDPHKPTSREEFDAIPKGQIFVNPADGRILTKK